MYYHKFIVYKEFAGKVYGFSMSGMETLTLNDDQVNIFQGNNCLLASKFKKADFQPKNWFKLAIKKVFPKNSRIYFGKTVFCYTFPDSSFSFISFPRDYEHDFFIIWEDENGKRQGWKIYNVGGEYFYSCEATAWEIAQCEDSPILIF